MALAQLTLKTEFLKLMDETSPTFLGWPSTREAACVNWTNAYDTYASTAQDISFDTLISANKAAMLSYLLANMPGPGGDIATSAAVWDQAFINYWTGATFTIIQIPTPPNDPGANTGLFSVELSSLIVTVTPSVLKDLLIAELGVFSNSAATKAENLATVFHTATTTAVLALISGLDTTTPTPLPITNTNPIL